MSIPVIRRVPTLLGKDKAKEAIINAAFVAIREASNEVDSVRLAVYASCSCLRAANAAKEGDNVAGSPEYWRETARAWTIIEGDRRVARSKRDDGV